MRNGIRMIFRWISRRIHQSEAVHVEEIFEYFCRILNTLSTYYTRHVTVFKTKAVKEVQTQVVV